MKVTTAEETKHGRYVAGERVTSDEWRQKRVEKQLKKKAVELNGCQSMKLFKITFVCVCVCKVCENTANNAFSFFFF